MHHEMRIGQAAVNFLDDIHRQNRAIGLARELIGAVRRAHGDGQRVDLGLRDEIGGLRRIGQQLIVAELALGAVAVFLLALAGLQRAEHAEFALDRGADPMRQIDDALRHGDIIGVIGGGLAVGLQRAVHHHRGEAEANGAGAGRFAIAVVLMHDDRNIGIHDDQRLDHLGQHHVIGVGARAAARLDDHGRVDGRGRLQNRQTLLHIIDVEGGDAVIMFGGVVEQLSQALQGPWISSRDKGGAGRGSGPERLFTPYEKEGPAHRDAAWRMESKAGKSSGASREATWFQAFASGEAAIFG